MDILSKNESRQKLHDLICDCYSIDDLKQRLLYDLNIRIGNIVNLSAPLRTIVFDLFSHFEEKGTLPDFLQVLQKHRQHRMDLHVAIRNFLHDISPTPSSSAISSTSPTHHSANLKPVPNPTHSNSTELKAAKVFISHSSTDKPFVRKLVEELQKHNIPVWFDEQEIDTGDSIVSRVSQGLKDMSYFVVVLSENSVRSPWVQNELDTALMKQISDNGAPVIALRIDDCEVPELLKPRLYADFRADRDPSRGLDKLLAALGRERETTAQLEPKASATSNCSVTLSKLSLGQLSRLIAKRMRRSEVSELWFYTFETVMEDDMQRYFLSECVIELLKRAKDQDKLHIIIKAICDSRSDLSRL